MVKLFLEISIFLKKEFEKECFVFVRVFMNYFIYLNYMCINKLCFFIGCFLGNFKDFIYFDEYYVVSYF